MQPRIVWAQSPEAIFMTIEVPETFDACIDTFEDTDIGSTLLCVDEDSKEVHVRLHLLKPVVDAKNEIRCTPRNIQVKLQKREEHIWERLLFDKNSYGNLAVDWEKWAAEEDDDDEDLQQTMPPNFDMSSLANMGGGGLEIPEALDDETEVDNDDGIDTDSE